jgi:hypothetical protein
LQICTFNINTSVPTLPISPSRFRL